MLGDHRLGRYYIAGDVDLFVLDAVCYARAIITHSLHGVSDIPLVVRDDFAEDFDDISILVVVKLSYPIQATVCRDGLSVLLLARDVAEVKVLTHCWTGVAMLGIKKSISSLYNYASTVAEGARAVAAS